MQRDSIITTLKQHQADIRSLYAVQSLSVFGSVARDEEQLDSDVDMLVEFNTPATFDGYMSLKFYLEELLSREVDLIVAESLRSEFRPYVEKDLLRVA